MYIPREDVERAKQVDLLTYLQACNPQELVRISDGVYCTREHDSLRISNGKWCWFSRGIGGRSAIDYLIYVKDFDFTAAVNAVLGQSYTPPEIFNKPEKKHSALIIPELNSSTETVFRYLMERGINPIIIEYCIENRLLFETKKYHNALFIGYDKSGNVRYGSVRGTNSVYKGELAGSDKRFSFSLCPEKVGDSLHVFESAIDAMSFATLELITGKNWRSESLLSLAGVFVSKKKGTVPVALSRFLEDHDSIKKIHLNLDNDDIGRSAAAGIMDGLRDKYSCFDEPPTAGKDVNDQLKIRVGTEMRERVR